MRPWLIALLLTLAAGTAHAGTLRCGTSLINEGDPMDEVLAKCGEPAKRVIVPPMPPRRDSTGKLIAGEAQLETWMYGPSGGAYRYLFFRDTKLLSINMSRKELL
ncbi:DUF2845 domain-containing protein [Pseudomonas nicosulfuronedens]|uniref:DUF2845 domain-containing protein n=1 Tax=Pseudomonas nicosulfuronedens TaxID=2571105 RepID=UPI00244968F2|nr:DUF2845 domain-containing protein [Pseudomonas nicosulfuronedens]MDH1009313.1 DUF2845 domain-containing protein [Pseudomonas nicosulfuronedens]MDH1978737.1 DUF2845 domain-containing protein [Pseudomonas nicosulfuronedens]MDH2026401.1 DUF2845 domain-containing protein [Pseudomonas nicosulfuronedens]